MNVHDRWMQWMNAGLSVKSLCLSVSLVFCAAVAEGVKSQRRSIHPLWFIESPWYASHLTQFITTKSSMWSTSGSENRHIKMQFEISPVPNFSEPGSTESILTRIAHQCNQSITCATSVSSISSCRRISEETCIEFSKLLCLELGLQSNRAQRSVHIKNFAQMEPYPVLIT